VATAAAIPARGWLDLEEDIADEFAPYAQRYNEIDDAYERVSSYRKKARQEDRRLRGESPSPRAQPHRKKTRNDKQLRERLALLVLAGYCAKCKKKREPVRNTHTMHCEECIAERRRRTARNAGGLSANAATAAIHRRSARSAPPSATRASDGRT